MKKASEAFAKKSILGNNGHPNIYRAKKIN